MSIKDKIATNKGIMDGIKEIGEKERIQDNITTDETDASPFKSVLKKQKKPELIRATYYLRQDQIESIAEFSELSEKGKNEFVRDLLDAAFAELRKA